MCSITLNHSQSERRRATAENDNCALSPRLSSFSSFGDRLPCDISAPGNHYSYQLNERREGGKNNPCKIIAGGRERERKSLEKWEGKIDEINLWLESTKIDKVKLLGKFWNFSSITLPCRERKEPESIVFSWGEDHSFAGTGGWGNICWCKNNWTYTSFVLEFL